MATNAPPNLDAMGRWALFIAPLAIVAAAAWKLFGFAVKRAVDSQFAQEIKRGETTAAALPAILGRLDSVDEKLDSLTQLVEKLTVETIPALTQQIGQLQGAQARSRFGPLSPESGT